MATFRHSHTIMSILTGINSWIPSCPAVTRRANHESLCFTKQFHRAGLAPGVAKRSRDVFIANVIFDFCHSHLDCVSTGSTWIARLEEEYGALNRVLTGSAKDEKPRDVAFHAISLCGTEGRYCGIRTETDVLVCVVNLEIT